MDPFVRARRGLVLQLRLRKLTKGPILLRRCITGSSSRRRVPKVACPVTGSCGCT